MFYADQLILFYFFMVQFIIGGQYYRIGFIQCHVNLLYYLFFQQHFIIITNIRIIMKRGHSPSPKPQYRNTRSKFFQKKQSDISKAPSPSHQQNTGDYWKSKGNDSFSQGNYKAAIQNYSRAIDLNNGESIYYSNRAKCYRNLNLLDKALKDAQTACQLDDMNIKAHYLCGCILAECSKKDFSKISKAENRLKKALRLCDTLKKSQFIDSISIKLFRLRKLKYMREEQMRMEHNKQVYSLIKKSYVEGLINKQTQDKMIKMQEFQSKQKPKQIPDHFQCKITLEVMEDPVTSQAGFTYQRRAVQDHFKSNGLVQPITRKPIKGVVYSNQALKLTIQQFMEENPWAFEFQPNQTYEKIEF